MNAAELQKDIDYLKKKLEAATDQETIKKITRQLESLLDSVVTHHLKGE